MNIIDTEISGKTATLLNDGSTPNKLLQYYAGVSSSQYTGTPTVNLVTNYGVRIEVDNSQVEILYPAKYSWKMSIVNQNTQVGIGKTLVSSTDGTRLYDQPVSEVATNIIKSMVSDAEKLTGYGTTTTVPEWKTMTKEYYTNGHGGETFKRYNTYDGALSKRSDSSLRSHVSS